jgi:hypothetical protein
MIKVYYGSQTWGGYVTTYDLLRAKTLKNEDAYIVEASLGGAPQQSPPPEVPALSNFSLLKADDSDDVYFLANDRKRYKFIDTNTFLTWYSKTEKMLTIPRAQLDIIPVGGFVTYKPGTRLLQYGFRIFAVDKNGTLRYITTPKIATTIFGKTWKQKVDILSSDAYSYYKIGTPIRSPQDFNPDSARQKSKYINYDKDIHP